jgi:hypothetical protein
LGLVHSERRRRYCRRARSRPEAAWWPQLDVTSNRHPPSSWKQFELGPRPEVADRHPLRRLAIDHDHTSFAAAWNPRSTPSGARAAGACHAGSPPSPAAVCASSGAWSRRGHLRVGSAATAPRAENATPSAAAVIISANAVAWTLATTGQPIVAEAEEAPDQPRPLCVVPVAELDLPNLRALTYAAFAAAAHACVHVCPEPTDTERFLREWKAWGDHLA